MRKTVILLLICCFGCRSSVESDTLLFPVQEEKDLSTQCTLSPSLALQSPLNLSGFSIYKGEIIVTADFMGEYCLEAYDLSSGDITRQLCRKGRGPGEFLAVSPMFSESNGILSVYDAGTGTYSEVDLKANDTVNTQVIKKARLLSPDGLGSPIIMSTFRLSEKEILAYNSIQGSPEFVSIDNPYYAVYDSESGQETKRYDLFNSSRLRGLTPNQIVDLDLSDCLNEQKNKLCFAMHGMPVIAFLDLESGKASGFRIKDAPINDPDAPMTFFSDICSDEEFIYALYYGKSWDELIPGQGSTILYKYDWDGKICSKYSLDGLFSSCRVASDTLYLSKIDSDGQTWLYRLDRALI